MKKTKLPTPAILAFLVLLTFTSTACAQVQDAELTWQTFPEAASNSLESGKQMLVFVYTKDCPWCRRLLDSTYTDQSVIKYINEKFELARVDAEGTNNVSYKDMEFKEGELAMALRAEGYPTHIFMKQGEEKLQYLQQVPGYRDKKEFLQIIRYFGEGAYETQTYKEFVES